MKMTFQSHKRSLIKLKASFYKKINQYYLDRTVILQNLLSWYVIMKWNIQVLKVRWTELDANIGWLKEEVLLKVFSENVLHVV